MIVKIILLAIIFVLILKLALWIKKRGFIIERRLGIPRKREDGRRSSVERRGEIVPGIVEKRKKLKERRNNRERRSVKERRKGPKTEKYS